MNEPDFKLIDCGGRQYRAKVPENGKRLNLGHFIKANEAKKENFDELIKRVDDSAFTLSIDVAPVFFPYLIGKNGNTKKKLENETGTTLVLPDKNSQPKGGEQQILIKGPSQEAIIDVKSRLEILMETTTKSLPYTHFISLPLNMDPVLDNAMQFRKDLIENVEKKMIRGFEPSIISNPNQLHITVAMLKLFKQSDIERLKSLMSDSWAAKIYDILGTRTMIAKIQELSTFESDPTDAHVVYLNVKPSQDGDDRLKRLCNFFITELKKENLLDEDQDKEVKIHVTLLNSKFRNKVNGESESAPTANSGKDQRISFDAKGILATYGKIDFGNAHLRELHLSQRGLYDANGYYHCVQKINFP